MSVNPPYVIGIDLGTTNCAVSSVDLSPDNPDRHIHVIDVPQLSGPGEISPLQILPSSLYLPGEHEIQKKAMALPWKSHGPGLVGTFALAQGTAVPDRLVSSAKSWLCHDRVDRKAPILPWGAGDDVTAISPVDATAAYLAHIKDAWNHSKQGDEDLFLENQRVIITVPASFDEAARDLTVDAANRAGIKNITLLEEPLAAFYSWLMKHDQEWARFVAPGELILVCDVGGGTTDFTLITLREKDGGSVFERIAVGEHLILGGDNMDLALARFSESMLFPKDMGAANIRRWQALCGQCRQAKEEILSDRIETKAITLTGEGRKVIGGTVSTTLLKKHVDEIILEGFFPLVSPEEDLTQAPEKPEIMEFGLPYAQDTAITRHLIRFLVQHKADVKKILNRENVQPEVILFNGAALKPLKVREKIRAAIRHYFNKEDPAMPRVLTGAELDLAVSMGASYYGLVKEGYGVRVGSGSARAYYLGVGQTGKMSPETNSPASAVCVVERGTSEGHNITLSDNAFQVLTNQPVSFDLYSSSFRSGDRIGDLIDIDQTLTRLPPIHTVIAYGKKGKQASLPVKVEAGYTEVGTLAIWCCSTLSDHRWRLQFQLRNQETAASISDEQILEQSLVNEALQRIRDVFGKQSKDTHPEHLLKTLSEIIDRPREDWPLSFIRLLADTLLQVSASRKRSIAHENRWYNLLGFCLRPGFGDAADSHRLGRLWKIFDHGPIHNKNVQVRSEWWVMWRRVAGGLSTKQQRYMSQRIATLLQPGKNSPRIRLAPQEEIEIWMTLANLERLSGNDKGRWARLLLDRLTSRKGRPQHWWALARLGAREPLYGPIDRVISAADTASWAEEILQKPWHNPKPVGTALSQMARLTGDRKRDLNAEVLDQIIAWLRPHDWADPCIKLLEEIVPMARQEENTLFGDSVPPGIVLHVEE